MQSTPQPVSDTDSGVQWGAVAITFLFFYYAAFGCTWGMVPWIYQAEINSLAMRVRGAAAATSMNWVGLNNGNNMMT